MYFTLSGRPFNERLIDVLGVKKWCALWITLHGLLAAGNSVWWRGASSPRHFVSSEALRQTQKEKQNMFNFSSFFQGCTHTVKNIWQFLLFCKSDVPLRRGFWRACLHCNSTKIKERKRADSELQFLLYFSINGSMDYTEN